MEQIFKLNNYLGSYSLTKTLFFVNNQLILKNSMLPCNQIYIFSIYTGEHKKAETKSASINGF